MEPGPRHGGDGALSAPTDLLAIGEAARPLLVEHAQLSMRLRNMEDENRQLWDEVGKAEIAAAERIDELTEAAIVLRASTHEELKVKATLLQYVIRLFLEEDVGEARLALSLCDDLIGGAS